jgi:SAM-dependent methyltransferase
MAEDPDSTIGEDYTARLRHRRGHMWKRLLPDPYRRNIRGLNLGRTLDVGCGIGRCLLFNDGNGIGVDHNPTSVAMCRERGLEAYGPEDFQTSDRGVFDSLLLSHVLEHLEEDAGVSLISSYLRFLRPDGKIVVITPQAAGQRSDPTHVRLVGGIRGFSPLRADRGAGRFGSFIPVPSPCWAVFCLQRDRGHWGAPG